MLMKMLTKMLTKMKQVLALGLFSLALCASAFAQPAAASGNATQLAATPEAQLLRALLDEVRQLRISLQRTNINTYRAQSLTGQLARQQNRVETLTEEIVQLKTQILQSQDTSRDEGELKELEITINETSDSATRAQLLQSYAGFKRSLARQREQAQQEAERQRTRQQQLEATLQQERARLLELQEQLEALDREFEKQITETRKNK